MFDGLPSNLCQSCRIGAPGYVGITTRGEFSPTSVITDARQRWLFRLVHTDRPLQERCILYHGVPKFDPAVGLVKPATPPKTEPVTRRIALGGRVVTYLLRRTARRTIARAASICPVGTARIAPRNVSVR